MAHLKPWTLDDVSRNQGGARACARLRAELKGEWGVLHLPNELSRLRLWGGTTKVKDELKLSFE